MNVPPRRGWRRRARAARRRLLGRAGEGRLTARLRERVDTQSTRIEELRGKLSAVREELDQSRAHREELAQKLATAGQVSAPPTFFLVGQAKSGTSWLMRLLDAHPEILCRGEGRIFGRDYLRGDLPITAGPTQPASLYRAMLESEYLHGWLGTSVWTREGDTDEYLRAATRAAIEQFMGSALAASGKRIVGDKSPFLGESIVEEIAEIMPGAKVIHIIRDGRDVSISAMHHLWNERLPSRNPLTEAELELREAYRADPEPFLASGRSIFAPERLQAMGRRWALHVERAMSDGGGLLGDRYLEVRYEDMRGDPAAELEKVIAFLGASTDPSTLSACVESASFERFSRGRPAGVEDSTSMQRRGVVGDWKRVFNAEDRRVFDQAAGEMLIRLGYERDSSWVKAPERATGGASPA